MNELAPKESRRGDTEMGRHGLQNGASPFPPFSASQKVWYDQALTRTGED